MDTLENEPRPGLEWRRKFTPWMRKNTWSMSCLKEQQLANSASISETTTKDRWRKDNEGKQQSWTSASSYFMTRRLQSRFQVQVSSLKIQESVNLVPSATVHRSASNVCHPFLKSNLYLRPGTIKQQRHLLFQRRYVSFASHPGEVGQLTIWHTLAMIWTWITCFHVGLVLMVTRASIPFVITLYVNNCFTFQSTSHFLLAEK